ncbi:MAG: mannose-1-phosphate guanylyltransferase [Thermoflexaceae bacterium]|nr:mannose-1-phosphate guanylyltransferase [Thermoflexaceae bacterium]
MKVYGVIMAGGGGTRFWPLSRQAKPKQLLNLSGKEVMVNEAVDRLAKTADKDDIFIVTNKTQADAMKSVTTGRIKPDHILAEPSARNTAACIGYAAMEILKKYGDGIMVITPSDAFIKNSDEFTRVLSVAVKEAEEHDKLVTVGITPTFPSTGYGYIKFAKESNAGIDAASDSTEIKAMKVEEFKEKPDLETAKAYVASGNYAWNSGMFIWKASTILKNFEVFLPEIYADIHKIGNAMQTPDEQAVINEVYPQIQSISIDYGIMEKSSDVMVVPGEFGWNDVGSFDMLKVMHDEDADGNVVVGNCVNIDTKNSVVYSSGRLVTTLGLDNVVVVETEDGIMVCSKDRVQDVKMIVEKLKAEGKKEYL